jgi:nicotinate-nucleotide pyrophosphorylase (carboxylating)
VEGPDSNIAEIVERALLEDAADRDSTTVLLAGEEKVGRAVIRARAPGTVSGQRCAREVFSQLDRSILYDDLKWDGSSVAGEEIVAVLEGSLRAILTGERTALNFLQHLSGVATSVRRFVERVDGTGAVILDTRKTTPGLRVLEKEAVLHGGGKNHRKDLADLVLVKENHIAAAGGLDRVIDLLGTRIEEAEIEVASLEELRKLRESRPWRIMLDNFTQDGVREAMEELKGWHPIPEIEVSGGVTIETVRSYAVLGVRYISVGAVTSSAPALDMSLIVEEVG